MGYFNDYDSDCGCDDYDSDGDNINFMQEMGYWDYYKDVSKEDDETSISINDKMFDDKSEWELKKWIVKLVKRNKKLVEKNKILVKKNNAYEREREKEWEEVRNYYKMKDMYNW